MVLFLNIFIFLSCLHIVYQDFKYKQISLISLLIISISLILKNTILFSLKEVLFNAGLNILFLGLIFFLITLYFSFKNKRLLNITDRYMGLGDIVLFLGLASAFSFPTFILFFNSTLIFTLIACSVILLSRKKIIEIPLAGAICIQYMILLTLNFYDDSLSFYHGFEYLKIFN